VCVTEEVWHEVTIGEFADASATYCMLTQASETSGGRSAKHNAAVGGVLFSAHRFFRAKDVVYDDPASMSRDDRVALAVRLRLKLIVEDDHDHLQPLDWISG